MSDRELVTAPIEEGQPSHMTNREKRKALQAGKRAKRESKELKRKRPEPDQGGGDDQEDPLSHKEQRRRRKLEKAAKASGEPLPIFTKKQDALPLRSSFSVWVGNLSFATDAEKLKGFMENRGVEGISRVHMPKGLKRFENNRGFAYIDLPTNEMVATAVGITESALDGRKLLIKSGGNFEGRPAINAASAALAAEPEGKGKTGLTKTAQKVLRSQKNPPAPTLFVGNLSFNSTEESLRALFENSAKKRDEWSKKNREEKKKANKDKGIARKLAEGEIGSDSESEEEEESIDSESESEAGEDRPAKKQKNEKLRGVGIRNIRMGTFEDSGKCKGWAFIDFFSSEYATASLIDPRNTRLDGRNIKLEYAGADAVRRGTPKSALPPTGRRPKPFVRGSSRIQPDRPPQVSTEELAASAPAPGTFDPSAPLPKKHKETQEERQARRGDPARRERPGAALANAKREKVGIVQSEGKKISFD